MDKELEAFNEIIDKFAEQIMRANKEELTAINKTNAIEYLWKTPQVKLLNDALLELKAIKESVPNRTLKDLQEIYDYVDCVLRVCDIDTEAYRELVFAKSKIPFIKQYILEAQKQEKELETVRADLTIELNNKKKAIKMFKQERKLREKQEKENAEYKKVLEILFEKQVDLGWLWYCIHECVNSLNEYNKKMPIEKFKLTQEEFDLLKRYFK